MEKKPRIFIGSAVESLPLARAIHANLDYEFEPLIWEQGVFWPSEYPIQSLKRSLETVDFAVFIFSPTDTIRVRGQEFKTVRDNVLFELGLSIGTLGVERTFFATPRNTDFKVATDLYGITPLSYPEDRSDANWRAALSTASDDIRQQIIRVGPRNDINVTPLLPVPNNTPPIIEQRIKEIEVISDESTQFLFSNWSHVESGPRDSAITESVHWNSLGEFKELGKSQWIADRPKITNDEAIKGGQYAFEKMFLLPPGSNLVSVLLYLFTDDDCVATINGSRLSSLSSQSLGTYDITRLVHPGENRIFFLVQNVSFESYTDPKLSMYDKAFVESPTKYLNNPYGLRYRILCKFIEGPTSMSKDFLSKEETARRRSIKPKFNFDGVSRNLDYGVGYRYPIINCGKGDAYNIRVITNPNDLYEFTVSPSEISISERGELTLRLKGSDENNLLYKRLHSQFEATLYFTDIEDNEYRQRIKVQGGRGPQFGDVEETQLFIGS